MISQAPGPSPFKFLTFLLLLGLMAGCVQFKPAKLYDRMEITPPPAKTKSLSSVVEPVIFQDDDTNVWGLEKNSCQEGRLTQEITHSGTQAIFISWNREAKGCAFSGIGFGWDDYFGKDLSEIVEYAGIEFYVRSAKGKMFGLPIVLELEDYSGGMGFAYTGNKYFERYYIDEAWQKVVVPLRSFDIETENLDFSNIKQLQLEFQQSGSIYLDDIRLVFVEAEPETVWLEEAVQPASPALPVVLFGDTFINNHGWGLIEGPCRKMGIEDTDYTEGQKSIHIQWEITSPDCRNVAFGLNWNQWHPIDLTPEMAGASLVFDLKNPGQTVDHLTVSVVFEDYSGVSNQVQLKGDYVQGGVFDHEWRQVTIPLSDFRGSADLSNLKQLFFRFEGKGDLFMDRIQLVKSPPAGGALPEIRYFDGSGNQYHLKTGVAEYKPVQPRESSSGVYSGGAYAKVALSSTQFKRLLDKALQLAADPLQQTPNRVKGSGVVEITDQYGQKSFILARGSAGRMELEKLLKDLF